MFEYVVIDTETTGVFKKDRIVEIALVHIRSGAIKETWSTLINPMRDISNSEIHGITPNMVSAAPTFEEISNDIARFIQGKVLVGHNISFDARMLQQELTRVGLEGNLGKPFCTMMASRNLLGITNASLGNVCESTNIALEKAHSALGDAISTAKLFTILSEDDQNVEITDLKLDANKLPGRTLNREAFSNVQSSKSKLISAFISKVPFPTSEQRYVAYLQLLNLVLEDFHISEEERRELHSWAESLQISADELDALHTGYLESFLNAALRDGVISNLEQDFLEKLSSALNIELDIPAQALLGNSGNSGIKPGMKVCFTGSATDLDGENIPRFELETLAAKFGLYPVSSVTAKSCNLLVAEDTTSMSGKAKKARDAGIQIISVSDFLSFCGK